MRRAFAAGSQLSITTVAHCRAQPSGFVALTRSVRQPAGRLPRESSARCTSTGTAACSPSTCSSRTGGASRAAGRTSQRSARRCARSREGLWCALAFALRACRRLDDRPRIGAAPGVWLQVHPLLIHHLAAGAQRISSSQRRRGYIRQEARPGWICGEREKPHPREQKARRPQHPRAPCLGRRWRDQQADGASLCSAVTQAQDARSSCHGVGEAGGGARALVSSRGV